MSPHMVWSKILTRSSWRKFGQDIRSRRDCQVARYGVSTSDIDREVHWPEIYGGCTLYCTIITSKQHPTCLDLGQQDVISDSTSIDAGDGHGAEKQGRRQEEGRVGRQGGRDVGPC